ncbi:uncharacterized protein LOC124276367 [Haliotis rubra]|uniref:uncharacterized protein LOC124276367 n=1 Tax=Haliotis rubra TaxID=36100 RepID=UPI001EE51EF2|nr:uncharacterized protein LOC124276367 [Haliotis rubra]
MNDSELDEKDHEYIPVDDSDDSEESEAFEDPEYVPDSSGDEGASQLLPVTTDKPKQILVQSCIKISGKREAKMHCCLFCSKYYSKMPRHMEQIHANEPRVARVLCLAKKSRERKEALSVLLREGDFAHNYDVFHKEQGVVLPKYRSREGENKSINHYLPCEFCRAFVIKTSLRKHQKTCSQSKKEHIFGSTLENSRQLLPMKKQSDFQTNILDRMREDSVTHIVKQDPLILLYGQRQYEKVGGQQHNWQYISQKMKELGRFLISVCEANNDVKSLTQCFSPHMFDAVIAAVKNVAGYESKGHTFATPSLALKLGYSLQKCCSILRNSAIRNEDEDLKKKATDFLEIYKDEWTERVSVHAHGTLSTAKYNRPQMLPLVEDVVCLHKYLDKAPEISKDWDTESRYLEFGKICLCQIILFNREKKWGSTTAQIEGLP